MFNLYLDNFRNFYNTHIPIKDVNFLVGENSSGKTSVLNVLELIGNYQFWFGEFKFFNESVDMRLFNDIVNPNSQNKIQFKIGFYFDESENIIISKRKSNTINIAILKFKNKNGIPNISEINFSIDNLVINLQMFDNSIICSYKFSKFKKPKKFLKYCINQIPNSSYPKKIEIKNYINNLGLFYNINEILSNINKKEMAGKRLLLNKRIFPINSPVWISPIRTKPQKTYDKYFESYSSEGEHTPYELNKILKNKNFKNALNKFGTESGLFNSIESISYNEEMYSPFQILINLDGKEYNFVNVGYGVSQILPILTEIFKTSFNNWFLIQQPEVHIHPRAQAELGELFFEQSFNYEKKRKFIIETHSDYIIDRFRVQLRKYYKKKKVELKENNTQILFFKRSKLRNKIYPIGIDNDGNYSKNQPKSFRDFFIKESMRILGL